jgi:ribonuclease T2
VKTLRDAIVVPDVLKSPHETLKTSPEALTQAFIAANANLKADNMAITCRDGELVEVRICVAKSLTAFAECPKVAGHTCHAASITIAPLR